jgi:hypothetical protein
MRTTALVIAVLSVCFLGFWTDDARAQATRTWVSGVGDDANPCSRTAPCKTFAGAISKTATNGEIDALDPGGFGAVTITKAITIDGGPGIAGVLVSGTNGIVVSAPSDAVVRLRNLQIDGLTTGLDGIKFLAGKTLFVERCRIFDFTGNGVNFSPNQATASFLNVFDSVIDNNNVGGILVAPAGGGAVKGAISKSRLNSNNAGLKVDATSSPANITLTDSETNNNNNNGVNVLNGGTAELNRVGSSGNGGNGLQANGNNARVFVSSSVITGNGANAANGINGGAVVSYGNNQSDNNGNDGTFAGPAAFH